MPTAKLLPTFYRILVLSFSGRKSKISQSTSLYQGSESVQD